MDELQKIGHLSATLTHRFSNANKRQKIMALRISITSKLDGIRSWSLQALETCPGSLKPTALGGGLVDACLGCYATQGNYRYPNVKAPRIENREDWQRDGWVNDMVLTLNKDRYFRWFDSGDMYALELAEKMYEVMLSTPWCNHWLPTRMAKFAKFADVIAKMQALPNVMVRFSSDSVVGEYTEGLHGSVIVPTIAETPVNAKACMAYENAGKCNGCRACWSKDVDLIAYPAHGKAMAKVIKIKLAA